MVLKELNLIVYTLVVCGGLERTFLTVSTLGVGGSLERTDF